MQAYVLRRLLFLLVTLWLMVTMLFFLMYVIPGDIAMVILGWDGQPIDPEQYKLLRHELGLDRPVLVQYGDWMWKAVHGNLGRSLWDGAPVTQLMAIRFPYTFGLMVVAMFWTIILTIPVGVLSALKQDTFIDYGLMGFQIGFMAAPSFWIGILLLGWLAVTFRWHPRIEYATIFSAPLTALQQYALPGILMGIRSSAGTSRMLRSSMLEVMGSDYVRTARAKGLKERAVVYIHTMRNAFLPMITMFGAEITMLLGGTVIMESLFNIPGLGTLLITAVNARDIPVVMGVSVYIGLLVLGFNLLVDLSYGWIDPRVRYD